MEDEIKKQLREQRELLEKTYVSVEKTRKYFLLTLILSLVLFVVPLVILLFILPHFISILTSGMKGF